MSASVASLAVGLLDRHYSAPSMSPELNVTSSPDVVEDDHVQETSGIQTRDADADEPYNTKQNSAGQQSQTDLDRRHTIGGLLAALATNAISKPLVSGPRRSATPPEDSPISQTSEMHLPDTQEQKEGALAESNTARLPSQDPNDQAAFQLLPPDPTLLMPTQDQFDALNFTQDELALPFPAFDMSLDHFPQDIMQDPLPINVKRQIDAYARLEFADGTFYLNTFQCELGRDQHAFRDALTREQEAKEAAELEKDQPKSSSGKLSQRSHVLKTAESQVQGSVVSEAGGFAGVDEKPIEGYGDKRNGQSAKHNSSQASESDIVRPDEVLHNPSLAPYDYHRDVVYQPTQFVAVPEDEIVEDERPAPVTAEHLPDPSSCPLIPIHTTVASSQTEVQNLRAISRRHVRIFWNWQYSAFYMEVLGRNGAFFQDQHMKFGESVRLHSGAKIQISAVEFVFRLPDTVNDLPGDDEDSNAASEDALEETPGRTATSAENGQPVKLKLKLHRESSGTQLAGGNAELKRRGPGRPPKNGIMSQREMKEREKAEKEAKARALHGIPSPPALERKPSKSQMPKPDPPLEVQKVEKRKYTKRKREDGEEEEVLPSIEHQEETPATETILPPPPQPIAKRARTKSYSPDYKPFDQCTPEDLARPPHNYAVLLYMVLSETGEITLRQIYKQMQARWPFFKYMVDSDGWTSSVRHNLNQEVGKLFERGRKEGKGFTWLPKPNAMEEYQAQKNKRSNAPPVPKPRPPPQRPSIPPSQGQQLTWQNSGPSPQQNRPVNGAAQQGPWPATRPGPNGTTPNINGGPQPVGPTQTRDMNYIPPVHLLPQHFGQPAPRFMPVTFEGLAVIHRFEQSMFQNLRQDTETQTKWRAIFGSAKAQALHGAPGSQLPGGETQEEATILRHIRDFVDRYRNPAFQGFNIARTASPMVTGASAPATNTSVEPTAATLPQQNTPAPQPVQPTTNSEVSPPAQAPPAPPVEASSVANPASGPTAIQQAEEPTTALTSTSTAEAASTHSHPLPATVVTAVTTVTPSTTVPDTTAPPTAPAISRPEPVDVAPAEHRSTAADSRLQEAITAAIINESPSNQNLDVTVSDNVAVPVTKEQADPHTNAPPNASIPAKTDHVAHETTDTTAVTNKIGQPIEDELKPAD
ncbi:hypothetical protein LTS08_004458 [Lithohypha guttulata]|nr:hypothetical protein LTS08_004458 [Lithohypha guttulata]